jgi:hypothetical protein
VLAVSLAPSIQRYFATDQAYVLKLIHQNIVENTAKYGPKSLGEGSKHSKKKIESKGRVKPNALESKPNNGVVEGTNITTLALDWEHSEITRHLFQQGLTTDSSGRIDAVIACDCIYNYALIAPFVQTCVDICKLGKEAGDRETVCIVAQQLRSPAVFDEWLKAFHDAFHVWKIPDRHLVPELIEGKGFCIHIGILRDRLS